MRTFRSIAVKRPFRPKGRLFTLVELLVVIAIVAVLASLLLPSLQRSRVLANELKCKSNLRQLGMAFNSYADDNGDFFPPIVTDTSTWSDFWDQTRIWNMIYPSVDGAGFRLKFPRSVFSCPVSGRQSPSYCSYGMNGWYQNDLGTASFFIPHRRSFASSPSKTILVGEGSNHIVTGQYLYDTSNCWPILFVHGGFSCLVYADNHAGALAFAQFPLGIGNIFWYGR